MLALILYIYGLRWGLPDKQHFHHSFHPDETASLTSSLQILLSPRALYPSPTALGNGSMQFYVVALVYEIVYGADLRSIVNNTTSMNLSKLYLIGRIMTILMSIGAAIILFLITQRAFGKICALTATLIFVSLPAVVVNTHYFRPDVPATFWILLSFLMTMGVLKSGKIKFYILSGLFAGFAASTKYNSILIFLPLICAHIMRKYSAKKSIALREYFDVNILLAIIVGIGAFFLGSPGTIIYWDEFRQRLIKQWSYQKGGDFMASMERGPGWTGYLIRVLPYSLGWPILILSLLGIFYAIWRHKNIDIMLLSWFVPYYFLVGSSDWWVVRYTVPLMPFLAIFGARILTDAFLRIKGIAKFIVLTGGIIVVFFTLLYSFTLDSIMAAKDPRIMAYDWIDKNVAVDEIVGFDFSPAAFFPCVNTQRYKTVHMGMDKRNFDLIEYYVANDQIYLQYLRLRKRYPSEASYFRNIFYDTNFRKVVEFENPFNILGLKFNKVDVPVDYFYFIPTITIYKKSTQLSGDEAIKNRGNQNEF